MLEIIPVTDLPEGDLELKEYLNYNPWLRKYTLQQQSVTNRNPDETDRGGWRGYNRVYSQYISKYKDDQIKLLEIGVHSGFGILAWLRYFKNAKIYGVELNSKFHRQYESLGKIFHQFLKASIYFFDSTQKKNWYGIPESFDVIIDDGSHLPEDQVQTLNNAWELLKPGGYFFIEDISNRYSKKSIDKVWAELEKYQSQGHYVKVYSHFNEGWFNIINNPAVWKQYRVTEDTPMIAEDYIAVIHKKEM